MTTLLRGSPAMPVWPPKALTDRRRPAPDALRAASVLGNQLAEKDGSTGAAHLLQELIKAGLEQPVCAANSATCCRHGHALARTKMREPCRDEQVTVNFATKSPKHGGTTSPRQPLLCIATQHLTLPPPKIASHIQKGPAYTGVRGLAPEEKIESNWVGGQD